VQENPRDKGLVRAVGTWGLTASIVNIVIGAAIFAVPGALAACIGSYAPLAFLGCALAIGAIAICFAEGGSRVPTSGGAYGYIEAAFGPLAGYVAGTLLWCSDALACGGISAALADTVTAILPRSIAAGAHTVVILGAIGGIAAVNIGGVAHAARLINAATLIKLLPLAVFIVAGSSGVHAANYSSAVPAGNGGLGRALILALFAFTGMETALCASGEVVNPARTIPRALGIAMAAVTVLYVGVQCIVQGILGDALGASTAPLADAMGRVSAPLRLLMIAGTALSMFGWLGSDILGTPRILFAFARDGLLPRALGRVHGRTHTPYIAILCYASLAVALALSGTFAELAVLSTLLIAAVYIAGCAAAWRLARNAVALAGPPLEFRWLGGAMCVGICSMLALIALASAAEIIGLAAALAVSAAVYMLSGRARRARSVSAPR
jgi:amino acid transporter